MKPRAASAMRASDLADAVPSEVIPGSTDDRGPRRPLQRVRLHAVRIAIDVARCRTARRASATTSADRSPAARGRPAGSTRSSPSRPRAARPGAGSRRRSTASTSSVRSCRCLLAHALRTAWSVVGIPPRSALSGPSTSSTSATGCIPPQRAGVRSTMIHDLVPLHFPDWVTTAHRCDAPAQVPPRGRSVRRRLRQLGVHGATTSSRRSASTRHASMSPTPASTRVHGRTGAAPTSARRTSSRSATLEPRKNLAACSPTRSGCWAADVLLAVVGGAGWGEQPALDAPGVAPARVRLRRASSPRSTAARPSSSTRRASRASGSRSSRRWRAARRASSSAHASLDEASRRRCGARRPRRSARRSPARSSSALAERDGLVPLGLEHARAVHVARRGRDDARRLWRRRDEGRRRRRAARADARRHRALRPRRCSRALEQDGRARARAGRLRRSRARGDRSCATSPGTRSARCTSARRRRRAPLHDVSRGPLARRRPVVVTVHDLRRAPPSRGVPTVDAALRPRRAAARRPRSADARASPCPSSRGTSSSSCSACPARAHPRRRRTRVDAVFTAGGPAGGGRLRARGRDARAAQEPRSHDRGGAAGSASSCASSGARGWGGVEVDGGRRWSGRVCDEELAALYRGARLPRLSVAVRGLRDPGARGDGLRHAGRDDRAAARRRRSRAARPCSSIRSTSASIAAGIRGAIARRDELRPLGLERARAYTWVATAADLVEALWRELA